MKTNPFALPLVFLSFCLINSCKSTEKDQNQNLTLPTHSYILFIGTYTSGTGNSKSDGIYVYEANLDSMKFKQIHSLKVSNPSYLCLSVDKKFLYCVNENNPGQVSAFGIDTAYNLSFINSVPSQGSYPCYISTDKSGQYVMVANYGSGSFALFGVNTDGSLTKSLSVIQDKGKGTNPSRQEGPHAHMIFQNAHNGYIYATDLGTDQVNIFTLDTLEKKLINHNNPYKTSAGAGPRHISIHPNGEWMYILAELSGTIEAAKIDNTTGRLEKFQTISTLNTGESRYPGSADIHITPDGKFLYATNRGEINNIACFKIDSQTGKLSVIGFTPSGGRTPRNFVIDPSGKFVLVAHQDSNEIVVFSVQEDGLLEKAYKFNVPMPVCLKFL
ncbi:MAG: lactonase family protein [Bacteroidales bacterium]|nr:lactonase family protein [Bacteroidales bacterium]